MTITISAQVPNDLYSSLHSAAKLLDRSSSYIIRQALADYLQELQEDEEDYRDAIKILENNQKTIPWEDIKKKYDLED